MTCKPFLSSYVSTKAVYVVLTTQKSMTYSLILSSLVLSYEAWWYCFYYWKKLMSLKGSVYF